MTVTTQASIWSAKHEARRLAERVWAMPEHSECLTSRRAVFQSDLCLPAPELSDWRLECQMLRLLLLSSK